MAPSDRTAARDDDTFDENDDYPYADADDPYDEGEARDPSYFSMPFGGVTPWPGWGRSGDESDVETGPGGPAVTESETDSDEGSWLDEGVISLLLLAGVVLFVIPEPATSTLGIFLVGLGLFAWLVDWLAG